MLAGRYRVEYVLGRGGMGVVVAALDLERGGRVALKFLLPATLSRADAVPRFLREARAAARLRSDHVARVSEVGTLPWGAPYLVMELLDGADLHRVVKVHGPLAIAEAVEYVLQACDAIAEAHALGIVHRDVKTENLFLTRRADGAPWIKVLDFGISKAPLGDAAEGAITSMTRTDMVMGSPQYMSPEQLRSTKDVDSRADVWSLGVVLYELTTAAFPFEADTLVDLMSRIIGAPPVPPRSRRAEIPAELEQIVLRCLEKDASLRYANAAELASALGRARSAVEASGGPLVKTLQTSLWASGAPWQGEPAPRTQTASTWDQNAPGRPRTRSRNLVVAAGAVAALGAVAAVLVSRAGRDDPPVEPPVVAATHAALPPVPAPEEPAPPVASTTRAPSAELAPSAPPAPPPSAVTSARVVRETPRAPPSGSARPPIDVFSRRKW